MATKLCCDGCDCEVKPNEVTSVGRYDPAVFCKTCLAKWHEYDIARRAEHAKVVALFEGWCAKALADLKAAGLARVPDEG